jgi:hypothetical protein
VAESVKITIPASVAAYIKADTPLQEKLRGAGGAVDLPAHELILLLFCLGKDRQAEVSRLAAATLATLDRELILAALDKNGYHPAVLHAVALACGDDLTIRTALLSCAELANVTRKQLETFGPVDHEISPLTDSVVQEPEDLHSSPELEVNEDGIGEEKTDLDTGDAVDEAGDEYLSKYKLAQVMGIGEKIKMALSGDKEWRKILVKDANKLVSGGVMKNPRMSEPEVLTVLKAGVQNDEIMRLICANKEWVKNYQIRKALIENPKTPLANALRYLGTMNEKELSGYAKSKNISSVVATQAKRMLLNKKR